VWPGPQYALFSAADQTRLFEQSWRVSSRSDRVGYRLEGKPFEARLPQMVSEPVRMGTIQVPESGQPIVTMRDGPTVGGYPKLGLVDADDLSWLTQCRPGQEVRFRPA
jgi:allophanate hydrolase subunit 2